MGITNIMPKAKGEQEEEELDLTRLKANTEYARENDKNIKISDFKIHKVLGRGSFGKVLLVEYNKDNK